jgi:DNA primase
MIDVEHLKNMIDCRDVVEHDLGQPKIRGRKYSAYKCPFHNETKGFSLVVYADHWRCFGKCGRGGDAIAWLCLYHNLSFVDACQRLVSGDLPRLAQPRQRLEPRREAVSEPPSAAWQRAAGQVAQQAVDTLWSRAGRRAWDYLEQQRGLTEDTILHAGLGYIPGGYCEWRDIAGLKVPCGITIPWYASGAIWGIKVRRAAGEQRYHQVGGGNIKGCLYLADEIKPGWPIFLTEGEFDALIARQVARDLLCAASIGSSANCCVNMRWYGHFLASPRVLARMDEDRAGESAAAELEALSEAVKRVQVPQGKDVNDYFLLAGHDAVYAWLKSLVE